MWQFGDCRHLITVCLNSLRGYYVPQKLDFVCSKSTFFPFQCEVGPPKAGKNFSQMGQVGGHVLRVDNQVVQINEGAHAHEAGQCPLHFSLKHRRTTGDTHGHPDPLEDARMACKCCFFNGLRGHLQLVVALF